MLMLMSLLSVLMLGQATVVPAPAAVVSAETIEATMKQSIANNTLDKKINETPIKGGIFRVGVVHRTNPEPRALLHDDLTEVYQIIQGSGTLVTGGTPQEARPVSDPPNLGPTPSYYVTQLGGVSQRVKAKDVVVIPAGLPHRFSQLDGPIEYVIYRFEVATK
jgi:mannose-6-phosphate isomerase-like protein (cupin superfamily)